VQSSAGILIFGAGHYSFFQNYGQACLTSVNCQPQIVNVDGASGVAIFQLATVGTTYQLSVGQVGVVNQNLNADGFQQTITVWTQDGTASGGGGTTTTTTSTNPSPTTTTTSFAALTLESPATTAHA
jgi:hypothetical protein